jgi:hypothetical protein
VFTAPPGNEHVDYSGGRSMRSADTENHSRTAMALILAAAVLLCAGCTNHYMTKQMLLQQVFSQEQLKPDTLSLPLVAGGVFMSVPVRYQSNRLSKIMCYNEKDEKVYVSVNQNTQLIVTDTKGDVHKFYLDTLYLEDNVLHGLRSRILDMKNSVSLDVIDRIEIYTELSREKSINAGTPPGYKEKKDAK